MLAQRKCEACRTSNDACDLRRPICRGCIAKSIACDYRQANVNYVFVDQNNVAALASHRANHRRSRETNGQITIALDTSLLETNRDAITRPGQPTQLAAPILHTLDDRVIQRYFSRWAAGQICLGCPDSIPKLFETSRAMQAAALAMAYADLTVFERSGNREMNSSQAYFGTLRRLQDELSGPNFVASDGILAAVLAIDAFELLYMGRTEPLGIHTKAIERLLELRKDYTFKYSYPLWRSANQRIHVRRLFCDLPSFASPSLCGLTIQEDNRPEVRTIKFVADACDTMSQLKNERDKPAEHANPEELLRFGAILRTLMEEAQEWCEHSTAVQRPRRVPFNVQSKPELRQVFSESTIIAYDNVSMARDRLLFDICCIKILDTLIALRTQDFASRSGYNDVDRARDFLLAAQADLTAMQAKCRFVLDLMPLLIGLVDLNGTVKVGPWTLSDPAALVVRSPLKLIGRFEYASRDIKIEANAVLNFFDAHRHVIKSSLKL